MDRKIENMYVRLYFLWQQRCLLEEAIPLKSCLFLSHSFSQLIMAAIPENLCFFFSAIDGASCYPIDTFRFACMGRLDTQYLEFDAQYLKVLFFLHRFLPLDSLPHISNFGAHLLICNYLTRYNLLINGLWPIYLS